MRVKTGTVWSAFAGFILAGFVFAGFVFAASAEAATATAGAGAGSDPTPSTSQDQGLPFPLSRFKLRNGLEVVLSEDDSLPLVSVVVAYAAGSIREEPGKTGLAYLLENMMFQGSLNVGPMQHVRHIDRIGGTLNATTTEDLVYFYQTVPANQLALVLWLESDRMRYLEINPARVEEVKASLIDEIRQRRLAESYLESAWAFDRLIYPGFAHSHPVVGREEDIRRLSAVDVREFYEMFYVPNNAVLAIAGSFNLERTRDLVEKYFETIPPGKTLPLFLPPRAAEKKEIVESFQEPLAPSPAFHLGFRVAAPFTQDFYALTIVDYLLLRGKSSRLYKRIIRRENVAFHLSGGLEKRKDAAVLKIFAMTNNETMADISQKAIFSELQKLKTGFVSEAELEKAKNLFR
ncbi:MAG: insulinase family protein, partial [Candidatus Aminicenantes bacterium]|nr:insulinase family protein [Candidatus Aminicenantes bacterium]